MASRRMSLPQSPSTLTNRRQSGGRLLPLVGNSGPSAVASAASDLHRPPYYARLSQPDLYSFRSFPGAFSQVPGAVAGTATPPTARRVLPKTGEVPKRFLRRANRSDLSYRFQREHEMHSNSTESTPSREIDDLPVDPVYLALKQATGKYGRRGSSTHLYDSNTPSPRNLSQVSLQDSGYVEMSCVQANPLLGSTPHLENAGRSTGRRRAPKLTTQMKSLSLDCQEMPPRIQQAGSSTRSPLRGKYSGRESRGKNSTSDLSDWDRSCSPCVNSSRRTSSTNGDNSARAGHIVIHEYFPTNGGLPLHLGERMHVVDNGDPDWLHGFRITDRSHFLVTFPATCVAAIQPGEQAMRILQNVVVPGEKKHRLYRDQIVFAQQNTLCDGKVSVRTEHNDVVACPLASLSLI